MLRNVGDDHAGFHDDHQVAGGREQASRASRTQGPRALRLPDHRSSRPRSLHGLQAHVDPQAGSARGGQKGGPLDVLPRKEAESTLEELKGSLELVERAAKCKQCDWPFAVDMKQEAFRGYRMMGYAIALKARLKIAEGKYDEAISSIQTGLAMGRHLGESSVLPHGLAGIAISAFMCNQVEQLVQEPDAPNVYWALKGLPRPLIDLSYQVKMQLEEGPARTKIEGLMDRLDRHVALLQCIEGLRHWAATHKGKFPGSSPAVRHRNTGFHLDSGPFQRPGHVPRIAKAIGGSRDFQAGPSVWVAGSGSRNGPLF